MQAIYKQEMLKQFNNLDYVAQCKYRTYFYRLQNGCITFMLTRPFKFIGQAIDLLPLI